MGAAHGFFQQIKNNTFHRDLLYVSSNLHAVLGIDIALIQQFNQIKSHEACEIDTKHRIFLRMILRMIRVYDMLLSRY
jgi:hypothetical protein